MALKKGDYVEHWEDGIGKVVAVGGGAITIHFQRRGKIELPREKTGLLKTLDPQGFWAQYFDNPDRVQTLVAKEPEAVVKLLIRDADPQAKSIERSRLKSLLTKGEPNTMGWRQDFALVEDWDAWWKIAARRLKKDPWIDTTNKTTLALRKEAVSEIQTLHGQFLKEKEPGKKIIISERLLKVCDKAHHEIILNDVRDFVSGLLQAGGDGRFLGQAVYGATNLQKKGVRIPPFDDHAYDLSLRALLQGKLSAQRFSLLYHFFSKLPNQNPNDHLILFLHGNDKRREEIVRNFKGKDRLAKIVRLEGSAEALTPNQAALLSGLGSTIEEVLNQAVAKASASIPEPFIAAFFLAVLLSSGIYESVKKAVAASVMDRRMDQTVYQYFIKADPSFTGHEIPFLHEFLKTIGPAKAEWALKNILLTRANANQKPSVFLAAFKALISDSDPVLSREQKGMLLSDVERLLSTGVSVIDKGLLVQISNLAVTVSDYGVLSGGLSDEDVVDIAKNRQAGIRRRTEAIRLLANRGLVDRSLALAQELIETIERDEFVLLQELMKRFPDTLFVKNVLRLLLERTDMSDSALSRAFVGALRTAEVTHIFCELIFSDEDKEWHEKYHQKVEAVLWKDGALVKEAIRFGLTRILSEQEPPRNLKNSFVLYLAPFMNSVIAEMRSVALEKARGLKADLENLSIQHDEELAALAREFEARLEEATTRTSQRYDHYLMRLIPNLVQIRQIQNDLGTSVIPSKDINDKLSVIREDIEVVLKTLKVIDIEQG